MRLQRPSIIQPLVIDVKKINNRHVTLSLYNLPLTELLLCLAAETIQEGQVFGVTTQGQFVERSLSQVKLSAFEGWIAQLEFLPESYEMVLDNGWSIDSNGSDELSITIPQQSQVQELLDRLLLMKGYWEELKLSNARSQCIVIHHNKAKFYPSLRDYLNELAKPSLYNNSYAPSSAGFGEWSIAV